MLSVAFVVWGVASPKSLADATTAVLGWIIDGFVWTFVDPRVSRPSSSPRGSWW